MADIPLSVILRTPVEIWVSCGENFINPDIAEKLASNAISTHATRNAENLLLDTEKHVLRQMTGNYCIYYFLSTCFQSSGLFQDRDKIEILLPAVSCDKYGVN